MINNLSQIHDSLSQLVQSITWWSMVFLMCVLFVGFLSCLGLLLFISFAQFLIKCVMKTRWNPSCELPQSRTFSTLQLNKRRKQQPHIDCVRNFHKTKLTECYVMCMYFRNWICVCKQFDASKLLFVEQHYVRLFPEYVIYADRI